MALQLVVEVVVADAPDAEPDAPEPDAVDVEDADDKKATSTPELDDEPARLDFM